MANQEKPSLNNNEADQGNSNETKMMLIATGVVALIILGGMGINMLIHHDTNASHMETTAPK
jgi:hypothetical protein